MKINRFMALAAIALLAIGAMGAIRMKVFAKGLQAPVTQSDACAQDQADGTEVTSAADTDNLELQCGDQNEADGAETIDTADTDNVQEETGDQSGPDNGAEAPEVQAPTIP
jgi:hypothetical protein